MTVLPVNVCAIQDSLGALLVALASLSRPVAPLMTTAETARLSSLEPTGARSIINATRSPLSVRITTIASLANAFALPDNPGALPRSNASKFPHAVTPTITAASALISRLELASVSLLTPATTSPLTAH